MELKGRRSKQLIKGLLSADDIAVAIDTICLYPPRQSVNFLFPFFYDKEALIRWRAIAAFSRVVAMLADTNMESARVVMRRVMWNLNDESGGIGWGSPEAMGEITALHSGLAKEFAAILRSYVRPDENFLEHEMLQRGVLWGIARLAEIRPECLPETEGYLLPFITSSDPFHRAFAARALGNLRCREVIPKLEDLTGDTAEILFFHELSLEPVTVGALAKKALNKISTR